MNCFLQQLSRSDFRCLSNLGLNMAQVLASYTVRPCIIACLKLWERGQCCSHGFVFCKECNEVWCVMVSPTCHHGQHDDCMIQDRGNPYTFFYTDSNTRGRDLVSYRFPFNCWDKVCDEQCMHDWVVLRLQCCRHGRTFSPSTP